jgi:serine phosphatase RsbU (regulator of sigma subunit)/predicted ester cyclase
VRWTRLERGLPREHLAAFSGPHRHYVGAVYGGEDVGNYGRTNVGGTTSEARPRPGLTCHHAAVGPPSEGSGAVSVKRGWPDREGYLRGVAEEDATFSITRFTIEDQIAEGEKVVTRYRSRSVHDRGEFMGVAPTGKEVEVTGTIVHRISGGKIEEEWGEGTGGLELMERLVEQERIERERVEQELRVARRIQHASLPETVPSLAGWEISPLYRPAREVGGDFFDFLELEDGRLGLVVGDATGKGVPAALVMSTTCGMLRSVAQGSDHSPGDVLRRVNEALVVRMPANMFVTCFYGVLEPSSGSFAYANAGHDLPYVRRAGDAEELMARGMPLGLMPGMGYEEREVVLEAGDRALFYSDGLVEAHNPEGEMLGFPRLRGLVAEHATEGSLVDFLMEELRSFTGQRWEQEDDITLVTLQRTTQ